MHDVSAQVSSARYSLWPRRPEALLEAHGLLEEQKTTEALESLVPYLQDQSIGGREARQLTTAIALPRYLSRRNPHACVYKVRSGDNMARIASSQRCSPDLILLLNGIVEPSRLNVGQKLVVAPMELRLEINEQGRELRLWDKDQLIAAIPIQSIKGKLDADASLCVSARRGYIETRRISPHSPSYPSSHRVLELSNGLQIAGADTVLDALNVIRVPQRQLNAIALLLHGKTPVIAISQK